MSQRKSKGGVFKAKFCATHRAAVRAANPNAKKHEIKAILKEMWKSSNDRTVRCYFAVIDCNIMANI